MIILTVNVEKRRTLKYFPLTFRSKNMAWHWSLRMAISFLLICCPGE